MNYSTIRELLKAVCSQTDLDEIGSDYEQYRTDGKIVECKLRRMEKMHSRNVAGSETIIKPGEFYTTIVLESYKLAYEKEQKKYEDLKNRLNDIVDYY